MPFDSDRPHRRRTVWPVKTLERTRLRAAAVYLLIRPRRRLETPNSYWPADEPRIVTLTSSSGKVGVPGGFVDRSDRGPWSAAAREWAEETGARLPKTVELACFIAEEFKGDTGIYLLELHEDASPEEVFFDWKRSDGEADGMVWRTLREMRSGAEGRTRWKMRECAVESTLAVLDWLEERGVR